MLSQYSRRGHVLSAHTCVCVCVCVCAALLFLCVCVCVCASRSIICGRVLRASRRASFSSTKWTPSRPSARTCSARWSGGLWRSCSPAWISSPNPSAWYGTACVFSLSFLFLFSFSSLSVLFLFSSLSLLFSFSSLSLLFSFSFSSLLFSSLFFLFLFLFFSVLLYFLSFISFFFFLAACVVALLSSCLRFSIMHTYAYSSPFTLCAQTHLRTYIHLHTVLRSRMYADTLTRMRRPGSLRIDGGCCGCFIGQGQVRYGNRSHQSTRLAGSRPPPSRKVRLECVTEQRNAQHSTAQHSTALHSTAQHNSAQHSTPQLSTAQYTTTQHSTAQLSIAQYITAQYTTTQHSTAHHSTTQYSTAHQSTAQHNSAQHSTSQHSTLSTQHITPSHSARSTTQHVTLT